MRVADAFLRVDPAAAARWVEAMRRIADIAKQGVDEEARRLIDEALGGDP